MSKSDWFWFTGLLLGIIATLMQIQDAAHGCVPLLVAASGAFCMIFSFFAPEHPEITIRLSVVESEKTPSPFGVHTSEDK